MAVPANSAPRCGCHVRTGPSPCQAGMAAVPAGARRHGRARTQADRSARRFPAASRSRAACSRATTLEVRMKRSSVASSASS